MAAELRAFQPLTLAHLDRLAELAAKDRIDFFDRKKDLAPYAERILSVALCQGGALHFVDGKNGVKDLDVWTLYAEHPELRTFPFRRPFPTLAACKGDDIELPGLTGWQKTIDCVGRSLPFDLGEDPANVWGRYLGNGHSKSARELAKKPVVLLEPASRRGEIVWRSK